MKKKKAQAEGQVKIFSVNTASSGALERMSATPTNSSTTALKGPKIVRASTIAIDVAKTAAKFNSANTKELQEVAAATQRAQMRLDTDGIPLRDPYTHASSWLFSFPCVDNDVP